MKLQDGTGSGNEAKVDNNNRLHIQSVSETEALHAAELGNAYNINTGLISITADATLIYLKNNEDEDLVVESIAIGSFEGITHSDDPYITIIKNPTSGDLIADATAVSINENRNFGSSKSLTGDAYKGKVSGTITGGNDAAILQVAPATRSFYNVDFILPKGSSIAIKLTANVTSGTANYYAAIICYIKDPESL
jgi:hypothetical protein